MDMTKYVKKKNNWIFDDTFQTDVIGTFLEAKAYKTNGGSDSDVFVFAIDGTDYLIMPFKVDYLDFFEEYGSDTRLWEGKAFKLTRTNKGKYLMVRIEEII